MAEAMKARIMARVESANIEAAQGSFLQTSQEAAAANAAAKASEEKEAVEMAKARARAEEEARKHKAEDAERSRNYQHAKDTAEASALRLRHEKESKQLAQANLAHKAKTAQRGIGTASVVLSPYDQLQMVIGEDSDPEEAAPEALAPKKAAKKAAMRGTSKKGVAFVNAPVEKKKDVAYYRAEIAAAEILGKHKTAETLYNEARALGFELPHWRSDGARARQLSARTVPAKDLTPAQYAKQEMDLDNNEDSESSRRAEPEPEPAPAAPVVQLMDRPQGSSEPIEAAIEELGSTITIRLQHARYDTKLGEPWRTTTKAVDGTVEIRSSKKDSLVLHFSSTDRTKGNLKGKITTPPRKPPRGEDGSESESSDEDDDLYAKDLVLAEFYREGARVYAGVPKTGGGKNLCEVTVGGIVHGSIPGGDSLPEFRRTIQHLSDRSSKDDDNGVMTARSEGGVTLVQGCICCPCQTQKNQLLVSGKSARSPGKALTELDASLYSVQDGCGTCRMDARKMVCKLPGNAHARLEIVIMFAYMAASLLTLPPK